MPKRKPIKHGTQGGYSTHYRRGEKPCAACRAVHNAAQKRRPKKPPKVRERDWSSYPVPLEDDTAFTLEQIRRLREHA